MRKVFAKGFAALLPMFLTIFVLYFIGRTLYDAVGVPVGKTVEWAVEVLSGMSEAELREAGGLWRWFFDMGSPIVGAILGCVLIFMIGSIVATFFGKKIYGFFEKSLSKLPVIKVVYPYAKQFTEFFFHGERKVEFKAVVAVPFPTEGLYSIGFPTSEGLRHLNDVTKKKNMCVFLPTSPTPFTGFTVYVPRELVILLPISVEEAMRIIISCGVVSPLHQAASLTEVQPIPVPRTAVPESMEARFGEPPTN